jgi:NAD(P)-dependent dehydrogenase (short-subunit alcohol dehydrogenase family)
VYFRVLQKKSGAAMEYTNKTVLVSGGAEGIGFAIARALGLQGMNVVLGDINESGVQEAAKELKALGVKAVARKMDVVKPEDWFSAVGLATSEFGALHALINNAGVGGKPGPIEGNTLADWQWCIDVNLMGVVQGMQACVPTIKQSGGGFVVNVGSMAGLLGVPFGGEYTATKLAVVGLSEAWAVELAPFGIHVAALCPAFVSTRIHLSERNRAETHGQAVNSAHIELPPEDSVMSQVVTNGIDKDLVGARVVEALNQKEHMIITHPNYRGAVQARFQAIDGAFKRAAESMVVGHLINEPLDSFVPQ